MKDDATGRWETIERFRIQPDAYQHWDALCEQYKGRSLRIRNKAHLLKQN
jgi:hypothetical protein